MTKKKNLLLSATNVIVLLFVLIGNLSCDKRVEKKLTNNVWTSFERTIEYAGLTVTEQSDQFAHYLEFNEDGTFHRTYEFGTWQVDGNTLFVTSFEADCESSYEIVMCTKNELILESKKTVGMAFVACGFGNDTVPKITEIYKHTK